MGRIPGTGIALAAALALAGAAAPASAGTWSSVTSPQATWTQPFTLMYDGLGTLYAQTADSGGTATLYVRPAGGGFGSGLTPIGGPGTPPVMQSDNSGRVSFLAGRGTDIRYNRRGPAGNFSGEASAGTGVRPAMSVSGLGSSVAGWAADASAGDNLILASRTATGAFAAETATTTPTIGLLGGLFPQVFAAADGDGSGIVVYFDDSPGDGDLSLIARDPGGSPNKWGAPTAISGTSAIGSAGLFANPSGDAILVWTIGSANHAAFRARDTTAFGADDPLPNGNVVSVAVQADGAVLAVVVSAGDATLYRRPAGGTGWTAISGPHTLNSLSGAGDAVVAASRTGDKVAFAWTQKPADVGTQAYRILAQVGTASDLGTPTTLPGQPATPGQSDPNPNHNELPAVAVDPSGNAAAVWRGYRSSSDPGLGLVFAALFDAASTTTPPGDPGASPPPGGTPPPADGAGTPPPGTPPAEDPVERLLGLRPPRTIPAGNGISVPVFCIPSNVNGCNGAIGAVISGSYRPGGPVFSSRRLKVKRFTYRLRPAAFSLRAGQRRTIKVKYPPAVRRAIRTALRHRGGRVTATVQATLRGRKSRKFVLRLKR